MQASAQAKGHLFLCFAHRGEARSFLSEFSLKALSGHENLYHGTFKERRLSLLISGEGAESTLTHLSFAIGALKEKFPEDQFFMMNLGVCGLLPDPKHTELKVGDVISIRTCFGETSSGLQFKSFTSDDTDSLVDVISSNQRVVDETYATKLSHFAPLVDREAWAFGMVCHQNRLPFKVLKVISDEARGEICAHVKEMAGVWSDQILREFQKTEFPHLDEESQSFSLEGLHITVSQERMIKNLLQALEIKGLSASDALKKAGVDDILALDIRPKGKTKFLIQNLSELLNPMETKLRQKLEEVTSPLNEAGFTVKHDQNYETEGFHLSTHLQGQGDINKLISGLESFDYLKYVRTLNGDQD